MVPDDGLADQEPSPKFDAEEDLLRRYEQMVQTQIATLNGMDDKAAYVARLVGLLAGLILSATSIAVETNRFSLSIQTAPVFALLALAITGLFISLVLAIITYLSSKFEYGPSSKMGEFMADHKVDNQQYKDVLLRGYSDAIQRNRRVVITNARRFQSCLAAFLAGLSCLFGAGFVLALNSPLWSKAIIAIGFVVSAILLARYIIREDYLTLDRRRVDNE